MLGIESKTYSELKFSMMIMRVELVRDTATSFVFFQSRFFFFYVFGLKTGRMEGLLLSSTMFSWQVFSSKKKKNACFFMAFLGKELRYFVLGELITKIVMFKTSFLWRNITILWCFRILFSKFSKHEHKLHI